MSKVLVTKREFILFSVIAVLFILFPLLFINSFTNQLDIFTHPLFRLKLVESLLFILFFLFNYFIFTTKYYFKKKYLFYIILLCISFLIIHKLPELLIEVERVSRFNINSRFEERRSMRKVISVVIKFLIFSCATLISLFLRQNKRIQEVKEEKQLSEIAYLRAQINPHFLFNTLNSIYALTLQKSDNASDAVMKLSKMMRYVVSDSSKDLVPLQHDLDYIKNYIQLQQLRIVDKESIQFSMNGNFNQLMISPLLLINFIENAFKYGIVDDVEQPIVIAIDVNDGRLKMRVVNTISGDEVMEADKSETGISNTTKRLDYIYNEKYKLDITEERNQFCVELNIDLND